MIIINIETDLVTTYLCFKMISANTFGLNNLLILMVTTLRHNVITYSYLTN